MRTLLLRSHSGQAALAAVFLATAAATSCGGGKATTTTTSTSGSSGAGGSTSASTGTSSASASSGGPQGIPCTSQPASLSLGGTWAAVGKLAITLQGVPGGAITICPAGQIGEANLLVLLTVQQDTSDPTKLDAVQATLCSIEFPVVTALVGQCDPSSPSLVSTQLVAPPAFIAALPHVATTPATGTVSGTTPGSMVTTGALDVTVGSTKQGSNMPKWNANAPGCGMSGIGGTNACDTMCVTDCASLRDDDMDTFPGVTIDVCGYTPDDTKQGVQCNADMPNMAGATLQGKGFMDFEVNPSLTGTAKSSCEISGTVASEVLYNLVGADVYLAGSPIPVESAIESLPTFQVDPSKSEFRMVRVDGQFGAPDWMLDPTQPAAACATIIMRKNQL